jgi:hypothetical protein
VERSLDPIWTIQLSPFSTFLSITEIEFEAKPQTIYNAKYDLYLAKEYFVAVISNLHI